jgi:hypothetical protein
MDLRVGKITRPFKRNAIGFFRKVFYEPPDLKHLATIATPVAAPKPKLIPQK